MDPKRLGCPDRAPSSLFSSAVRCTVRVNRSTLSHVSATCGRSPEVSSTAFHAQPLDLPPVPLMDVGFAIICPLARHRRPPIKFLFIGSRVSSTLLSYPASRLGPCASLTLHLRQVGQRTFTSKLSNMLGTQMQRPPEMPEGVAGKEGIVGTGGSLSPTAADHQ